MSEIEINHSGSDNGRFIKMKRSISMPVKPRYLEDDKSLERSEEKETLFSNMDIHQMDNIEEKEEMSDNEVMGMERRSSQPESVYHDARRSSQSEIPPEHEHQQNRESREELETDGTQQLFSKSSKADTVVQSPCVYEQPQAFRFSQSNRLIKASGQHNIVFNNIPQRRWQYFKDWVTTMIECKWRYTMLLFLAGYFGVWYLCTAITYMIAFSHGDLTFNETTGERLNDDQQPCVIGADTFTGMFIYTMETHTSIGFGNRYPTDECPEGVFFYAAQLILYIGVEGMLISIVYSKIARPITKVVQPKFSKRATICLRDGKHCLVIRLCDRQQQQSIGTKVTVYFLQNRNTLEGEYLPKSSIELKLENDGQVNLLWPTTICHVIDRKSSFYKYAANDFLGKDFEIIVSCTGTSPSTGQFTECIKSYIPNEIYWGERFTNIVHYDWKCGSYVVDYENFDKTVSVKMPMYSAYQFHKMYRELEKRTRSIAY